MKKNSNQEKAIEKIVKKSEEFIAELPDMQAVIIALDSPELDGTAISIVGNEERVFITQRRILETMAKRCGKSLKGYLHELYLVECKIEEENNRKADIMTP